MKSVDQSREQHRMERNRRHRAKYNASPKGIANKALNNAIAKARRDAERAARPIVVKPIIIAKPEPKPILKKRIEKAPRPQRPPRMTHDERRARECAAYRASPKGIAARAR